MRRLLLPALVASLLSVPSLSAQNRPVQLVIQDDEARAALDLLDTLVAGHEPSPSRWQRLWDTDGYHRLKRREAAIQRPFTDSSFAAFLRKEANAPRRDQLRDTLNSWARVDLQSGARQALDWLPAGAHITATVYPLIKPYANSFVFDTDTDPAIMLYVDPTESAPKYTNTVIHELHHIGYASVCTGRSSPALTDRPGQVRQWLGAFGEGFAMLAAAGGPTVHPHVASPAEERQRWDKDVGNFDRDLHLVEGFVRGVMDGTIAGDSILAHAREFYGVQGPWYTVGWKMAAVVVEDHGKSALLGAMCDPIKFLAEYNRAADARAKRGGERLAMWDAELLRRVGAG